MDASRRLAPSRSDARVVDRAGERGVILIVLVVGIAVMMIGLGLAAQSWTTIEQREREAEFIFRGRQIVRAIDRYQQDNKALPTTLNQLYEPGPKGNSRYVRRKWKDPLTGGDWVLLWLGPDNASLFRSDGRASTSGSFGAVPGAQGRAVPNQRSALDLAATRTLPFGSPSAGQNEHSLLDEYKRSRQKQGGQSDGKMRPYQHNPEANMDGFDTTSSLLTTPGIGPIAGVATSYTGKCFFEWKGQTDYGGYEVSIFSERERPVAGVGATTTPQRNIWEMPGTPVPDPSSDEGKKFYNTGGEQGGSFGKSKNGKPKFKK